MKNQQYFARSKGMHFRKRRPAMGYVPRPDITNFRRIWNKKQSQKHISRGLLPRGLLSWFCTANHQSSGRVANSIGLIPSMEQGRNILSFPVRTKNTRALVTIPIITYRAHFGFFNTWNHDARTQARVRTDIPPTVKTGGSSITGVWMLFKCSYLDNYGISHWRTIQCAIGKNLRASVDWRLFF